MTDATTRAASAPWIMLPTFASTATTLATLAAAHMRRRDGTWPMAAAWVASQAVGFGLPAPRPMAAA